MGKYKTFENVKVGDTLYGTDLYCSVHEFRVDYIREWGNEKDILLSLKTTKKRERKQCPEKYPVLKGVCIWSSSAFHENQNTYYDYFTELDEVIEFVTRRYENTMFHYAKFNKEVKKLLNVKK